MDQIETVSSAENMDPIKTENMDPIKTVSSAETYVKRFRLYGTMTTFKFNPVPDNVCEIDWLRSGFSKLVEDMKAEASEGDQIGFTLRSLNFKNKEPGYVAFRPASEVDGDILWQIFGGIVQSNADSIKSTYMFQIECTRVNLPVGSGKRSRPGIFNNFNEECKTRHGIVTINNTDNLCLARALVVGKAHAKKNPNLKVDHLYKAIRQDRAKRQTNRAVKLISKAQVQMPAEGAGIPELEKFQAHLKKYKITVYNFDRKGREVYFSGGNSDAPHKINL